MGQHSSRPMPTFVSPQSFVERRIASVTTAGVSALLKDSFLGFRIKCKDLGIRITLFDLLHAVHQFISCLKNSNTMLELVSGILSFLKDLTGKTAFEVVEACAQTIVNTFTLLFGRVLSSKAKAQSIDDFREGDDDKAILRFFKRARHELNNLDDNMNTEFGKRLTVLFSTILALPICIKHGVGEHLGFHNAQLAVFEKKRRHEHKLTWVQHVCDDALYIMERSADAVLHKDFDRIYYDDEFLQKYRDFYKFMLLMSDKIDTVCSHQYRDFSTNEEFDTKYTLVSYLQQLEELKKANVGLRNNHSDKKLVGQLKLELAKIEMNMCNVMLKLDVSRERSPPFAFAVCGTPSIGKSQILDKIFKIISDICVHEGYYSKSYDAQQRYDLNPEDDYFSGYLTSHKYVVIDDLGAAKPEVATHNALKQLIAMINSVPMITNQAELENKGRIPFLADVVAVTSNKLTCGFEDYFIKGGGILRRFIFIDAVVRPEFCHDGESRLKGDMENPNNPELHYFGVRKYKNVSGTNVRVIWNKETQEWEEDGARRPDMSLLELALFLKEHCIIPHHQQVAQAKDAGKHFMKSEVCKLCGVTSALCSCVLAQSDDIDVSSELTTTDSDEDDEIYSFRHTDEDDIMQVKEPLKLTSDRSETPAERYANQKREDFSTFQWYWIKAGIKFTYTKIIFYNVCASAMHPFAHPNWFYERIMDNCMSLMGYSNALIAGKDYLTGAYYYAEECLAAPRRKMYYSRLEDWRCNNRRKFYTVAFGFAVIAGIYWIISIFFFGKKKKDDEDSNIDIETIDHKTVRVSHTKIDQRCDGIIVQAECEKCLAEVTAQSDRQEVESLVEEGVLDVWTPDFTPLTRFDRPQNNITEDQLIRKCERNIIYAKYEYNDGVKRHSIPDIILGIHGNIAVIAKHYYLQVLESKFKGFFHFTSHNKITHNIPGSSRHKVRVDETCFKVFGDTDIVLFQHAVFGCFTDLRRYLLKDTFNGKTTATIVERRPSGKINTLRVNAFQNDRCIYTEEDHPNIKYDYDGYSAFSTRRTFGGMCGSPYIVRGANGYAIGGIHVAMRSFPAMFQVFICPIPCGVFDVEFSEIQPMSFNGFDANKIYTTSQDLSLAQSLHVKSPLRNLNPDSSLRFYGDFVHIHRPKFKTLVCPTLMHDEVLEHFNRSQSAYVSPKGISWKKCVIANVNKMCVKSNFKPKNIRRVRIGYEIICMRLIDRFDISVPNSKCDLFVAVNGLDGQAYVNRLPGNTSGGFAHKGRKDKHFIEVEPRDGHNVCYVLSSDILREIEAGYERIANGERLSTVWDSTFKDEPITRDKHAKNKCRIFNSSSLFFSVMARQAFLWVIPIFTGVHRHHFGVAIGLNCSSKAWTIITNHITRFGADRIIAGDYASFDKRMEPGLILAAFQVLINIAKRAGFPEDDILLMRAVATEIAYPITNVFGTLVEFFGTNPSGHNLTTIINSIVNIFYMMLACMEIAEEIGIPFDCTKFFSDYMSLLTYGDDNIASSNVDAFNHTNISTVLGRYGVEYTMADKTSESVPFICIEEADFLKRSFVKRKGHKWYSAPLDQESIIKSLSVCTRSRVISFEQQCAEIIRAANLEYFHYGRRIFNARQKFLDSLLDKYNLRGYLSSRYLPCYEEIYVSCYGDDGYMAKAQSIVHSEGEHESTGSDTASTQDFDIDEMIVDMAEGCGCMLQITGYFTHFNFHRELHCDNCHMVYLMTFDLEDMCGCDSCEEIENDYSYVNITNT